MMSESFSFQGFSPHSSCKDVGARAVLLLCLSLRPGELGAAWLGVIPVPLPLTGNAVGLCFVG